MPNAVAALTNSAEKPANRAASRFHLAESFIAATISRGVSRNVAQVSFGVGTFPAAEMNQHIAATKAVIAAPAFRRSNTRSIRPPPVLGAFRAFLQKIIGPPLLDSATREVGSNDPDTSDVHLTLLIEIC